MSHHADGRSRPASVRAERTSSRVFVLDGLRLVAALSVVLYHLVAGGSPTAWGAPTSDLFPPLYDTARYGWLGVEMFFLISGFVICMSSWRRTLGEFAISRITRLYPAYWFAVLATTAVVVLLPVYNRHQGPAVVLANLTMLQGLLGAGLVDPSYWTLAAELVFYLLFAVIVVTRGVTYRRVVTFCVIWTVAAVLVGRVAIPDVYNYLGPRHSAYFIAGVAFYLIYRFGPSLLLWGIVGISWSMALYRLQAEVASFRSTGYWPAALIVTALFALMGAIALGAFERIRWRWLTTAGVLTYPLYLLHQVVGLTVITALRHTLPPWVLLAGVVGGMLLAAWLVHRIIERPVARFLRRGLHRSLDTIRAGDQATGPARVAPRPRLPLIAAPAVVTSHPIGIGLVDLDGAAPAEEATAAPRA